MRLIAFFLFLTSLSGATLSRETQDAFAKYISQLEAQNAGSISRFPDLKDSNPQVVAGGRNPTMDVPDGMIHDWVAAAFAPGMTLAKVLRVLQDYNNHHTIYAPEVVKSRLISQNGNQYRTYLRLRKKKIITVELNTEYQVDYHQQDPKTWTIAVRSARIAEIEDAGEPKEKEMPPGTGWGFLWNLNSYWLLVERDGGVYLQCRAVSLTRDIPLGTAWAVKPMVTSLPRESLTFTLEATIRAAGSK